MKWDPTKSERTEAFSYIAGALTVLIIILALSGCGHRPVPVAIDSTSWEIPVVANKVDEPSFAEEALHPMEPVELLITVPASTVETVVRVRKARTNLLKKALTNAPEHKVESSTPGTKADQPKKVLWWRWLAALLLLAFIVLYGLQRVMNLSPVAILRRILSFLAFWRV